MISKMPEKEVTYFYRNVKVGFSINKVFNTITEEVNKHLNIEKWEVPYHNASIMNILRNIYFVYKHRNKKGINHMTGDIHYISLGLIGCESILTIHDTSAYDHCNNRIKKFIIALLWFYIPLKICGKIVCISESTRKSVQRFTKRKDISVIPNPILPLMKYSPKMININKPVILQIGTSWNKNIFNVALALKRISCSLRIVGKLNKYQIEYLDSNDIDYSSVYNLTDEEIYDEYKKADIICFCSFYEGFGMPIIEGNSVGRCVVTSNISPLNEIGSDAVCYSNPNDPDSIYMALRKILDNSNFQQELIFKGLENIKRNYRVETISAQYLSLYSNCKLI